MSDSSSTITAERTTRELPRLHAAFVERIDGAIIAGVPLPTSHGVYRVGELVGYADCGIEEGDLLVVDHELRDQAAIERVSVDEDENLWMIFEHDGATSVARVIQCEDPLILTGGVTAIIHQVGAFAWLSRPAPALDDLLDQAGEMWREWRREHPYVDIEAMTAAAARPFEEAHAAAWERVREEVIPTDGATLLTLAGDPRLFERVHDFPECSIKGAIGAAVEDALLEHCDAIDEEARS